MDLSKYDGKHVRITDRWKETFTGMAAYAGCDFLECEYGGEEDGIFIESSLIYHSQIVSIEEIEVHGTVELWTEHLILRRYHWNPYATLEMAQETVRKMIESYADAHSYSWVMDVDDVIVGTIGAYDYAQDEIEVGFSVERGWQGRSFATEALRKVLAYLTENEGISCVTAWCAAENKGSRRVLEKAGMKLVRTEKDGLAVREKTYDKLIFAYHAGEKHFKENALY